MQLCRHICCSNCRGHMVALCSDQNCHLPTAFPTLLTHCSYLGFWHNGIAAGSVTKESWKWRWDDDWVRTDKATEITAGNGVLLCLHHKCVHGIEAVPWQPHCPFLAHERRPLKVQRQGCSTICNQVKPRKVWPSEVARLRNSSNHIPG